MMEETGIVVGLSDDRRVALVQCRQQSACASCPATAVCRPGEAGQKQIEALNHAGASLHDQVKVAVSSRNFLRSSFILYILPIVGLLFGALIGHQFGVRLSVPVDPDLLMAATGTLGLAGVFILIHQLTRRLKRETFMPVVVSIESHAHLFTERT